MYPAARLIRKSLLLSGLSRNAWASSAGATRWLIERYRHGDCDELTQYTVFPDRLTWLHKYAAK